jgi:hypothetical protein
MEGLLLWGLVWVYVVLGFVRGNGGGVGGEGVLWW